MSIKRLFSSPVFYSQSPYLLLTKNTLQIISLCILLFIYGCTTGSDDIYQKTTTKSFQDVVEDTDFVITEHNFRITNRLHIGSAIQERGHQNFPQNEIFLFCNLSLAEAMLTLEPRYINYCPYKITITDSGGFITVGTRLIPEKTDNSKIDKIAKNINKILRTMVEYAASDDLFILEPDQ